MKLTPILIAVIIAAFFISCKNSTTSLPVPKDAFVVVHINASSLNSKLSWKEIQATEWFKTAYSKEEDSLVKKLMDDPGNSGIDIKSDFVFFMKKESNSGYVVFEGKLKDAKAFEGMVKKIHRHAEVKQDGDLNYVKAEGTDLISWTHSKFILMSDALIARTSATTLWEDDDKNHFHQNSLIVFAKNLLDLSSAGNLESDKRFTSLIKENGDLHFWMNMDEYLSVFSEMMGANPVFSMMQGMNALFEGSVAAGTLSFDDGKITVKSKRYVNDKMKQIMDKYPSKNITAGEVNRIPSNNVQFALVANYAPQSTKELLKTMGIDGFINGFLGRYHTSLGEVVQATKGNLILSASDFSITSTEKKVEGTSYTYRVPETKVTFLLGLSVNNKSVFDKLITIAQQQIKDPEVLAKINYKSTNDWFAVSNSSQTVDQFLAGANSKLAFADKITGHLFGVYIDLQKFIKGFQYNPIFPPGIDSASASLWQDIVATGGDYKDGVVTGELTINMVDKNTNSLKQLNQYADKIYRSVKKKDQEYRNDYRKTDSAVSVPPADTSAGAY